MSELVEKVAIAVEAASAEHAFDATYNGEARAAIKAVAEWLQSGDDFYSSVIGLQLERQLEDKT
jgi:hypothetical protein